MDEIFCKGLTTMKKTIILILYLFFESVVPCLAQDIIVLTDSTRIEAKIFKINKTELEYKKLSYLDGPSYVLTLTDIARVEYPNGDIESFEKEKVLIEESTPKKKIIDKKEIYDKYIANYKGNLLKRGNLVYVKPADSNLRYEVEGAKELVRQITISKVWKVVPSADIAHFIIEYHLETKGRDRAYVAVYAKNHGGFITGSCKASEDLRINREAAKHIFEDDIFPLVQELDKGKTPRILKNLEVK